jgi:hypothetical protein
LLARDQLLGLQKRGLHEWSSILNCDDAAAMKSTADDALNVLRAKWVVDQMKD